MQCLQTLLLHRLDLDRLDVGAARRFEQRQGIGRVGLATAHVRAHIVSRQQHHLDAASSEHARPVMCRAAGLHHDAGHLAIVEEALELSTGKAVLLEHAVVAIGQCHLEDVLRQIDRSGSSIHFGLLPSRTLTSHPI